MNTQGMTFTEQEIRALRHLWPMYKDVCGESTEEKKAFFEKAYLIWFDYCPMHRPIEMGTEEFEWLKNGRKKVCILSIPLVLNTE